MSHPMRRNYGRRKSDRFKIAAGMGIAFVFFMLALQSRCGSSTEVAGPSPTNQAPAPSSQQAAASPAPAPRAVDPTPAPTPAWTVTCAAPGSMTVAYDGEASHAEVETYYTSFDGPARYGVERKVLPKGGSWGRTFPACHQSDAEPISGRPAGHCFFDKDGKPTTDRAATESCKVPSCVEKWTAEEEYEEIPSEWGACTHPQVNALTYTQPQCSRSKTVTRIYYESNSCTRARRELRRETRTVSEPCECTAQCESPSIGTKVSFAGKGDPDTECSKFGEYESTEDFEDGAFFICKAGNDRIVQTYDPTAKKCSNNKDVSHWTACICKQDD